MQTKNPSAESDPSKPLVDPMLKGSETGPEGLFETLPRGPEGLFSSIFDAYDPAGQLTQILHRKTADNTALAWANYAYDPAGNRTSMTDHAGTHAYGYDDLHRLISTEHPSGSAVPTKNEAFDYDRAGNRLFDANITGYQYDAANRLLSNSSFTYAYDNNGNQTGKTLLASGQTTAYAYNAENQLVQADMPDGTRQTNAYDGLGRRIEKSTGPVGNMTTVRYVYDNEDILAMLDGNNNLIALFTHGPGIDEPNIMKEAGGPEYFFHADALGSITALSDEAGEIVERIEYEAYGTPRFIDLRGGTPVAGDRSFTGSAFAFTAREWDAASGFYFYRARYYEPGVGRFLQEDLIGVEGRSSRYVYANGNPAIFIDPFGDSATPPTNESILQAVERELSRVLSSTKDVRNFSRMARMLNAGKQLDLLRQLQAMPTANPLVAPAVLACGAVLGTGVLAVAAFFGGLIVGDMVVNQFGRDQPPLFPFIPDFRSPIRKSGP